VPGKSAAAVAADSRLRLCWLAIAPPVLAMLHPLKLRLPLAVELARDRQMHRKAAEAVRLGEVAAGPHQGAGVEGLKGAEVAGLSQRAKVAVLLAKEAQQSPQTAVMQVTEEAAVAVLQPVEGRYPSVALAEDATKHTPLGWFQGLSAVASAHTLANCPWEETDMLSAKGYDIEQLRYHTPRLPSRFDTRPKRAEHHPAAHLGVRHGCQLTSLGVDST
jgi:hypothetical protein